MATTTYHLGELSTAPKQEQTYLNDYYTEDVYTFKITGTRSINLNLHAITAGDNANLYLYRDTDQDRILDPGEPLLSQSLKTGNTDDSVNYLASAGSYLAVVRRYAPGSQGRLDYHLDLSATPSYPYPSPGREPPNLLPKEFIVGGLTTPNSWTGRNVVSRSNAVGNSDTADTFSFSVPERDGFDPSTLRFYKPRTDIKLINLTADADIRVIQDRNFNSIVDSNEIIGSSVHGGTASELIASLRPGDYCLQVYQYSGNTNYQVRFETYWQLYLP